MRRPAGLLCVAAALCLAAPAPAAPAAAAVEPGAVVEETALASWMFPTQRPRHSKWIFAGAYRNAAAGGRTLTTGFAVKGRCEVVRERGDTVTRCHGRGVGGRIPDGAFAVDPALREARLVLKDGGASHRVEWRSDATAAPSGYVAGETCDEGTGQGAGFMKHALASGRLFERRLGHAGTDHAILSRGGMLTECTGRSITDLARRAAAGKVVTFVFR